MFVFGGDSQDKGIGDIRFVRLLLALKFEYPGRVEFIIGNRDANKLRLASELDERCISDQTVLTDSSFPYWDSKEKRVTPQMFLDKNPVVNGGTENTAANRLRYILKHTMGADGAFERRRHELSIIQKCVKEQVSDDMVVQSYRNEVDPGNESENFMLKFLEAGKLAYIFGANLFLHGAVNTTNMGKVPGKEEACASVREWVEQLNQFAANEVLEFKKDPFSGKTGRHRKGAGLMDYGVPGGNGNATVIYSHFLDNGNAKHIARAVQVCVCVCLHVCVYMCVYAPSDYATLIMPRTFYAWLRWDSWSFRVQHGLHGLLELHSWRPPKPRYIEASFSGVCCTPTGWLTVGCSQVCRSLILLNAGRQSDRRCHGVSLHFHHALTHLHRSILPRKRVHSKASRT